MDHLVPIAGFAGNGSSFLFDQVVLQDPILFLDFGSQVLDVFLEEVDFLALLGIVPLHADHLLQ